MGRSSMSNFPKRKKQKVLNLLDYLPKKIETLPSKIEDNKQPEPPKTNPAGGERRQIETSPSLIDDVDRHRKFSERNEYGEEREARKRRRREGSPSVSPSPSPPSMAKK